MTYSPFSDRYGNQYGVPTYMLDSAAKGFGTPWASNTEELARDIRAEYDKTGSWETAIDRVAESRQAKEVAAEIKKESGLKDEGDSWFSGWGSGVLDANKWETWAKSGFVVLFGAVLIVLALLAYKPTRDVAAGLVLKKRMG